MTADMPLLEAVGLSYRVGSLAIASDFSLCLRAGQAVGLIGPNGAGKTTVIDLLSGFLRPAKGSLRLRGRDITCLSPDARTRYGLARSFQASPAIPGLTVLEHVQLPMQAVGRARRARPDFSPDDLLARFGLDKFRDVSGTMLPTIERRLLDLARVMGTRPDVVLLDEPFAGLGTAEACLVTTEIRRLVAKDATVLIIDHRLAMLRGVVGSVIGMVHGTVVARGQLDDVLGDSRIQEAFLGRMVP